MIHCIYIYSYVCICVGIFYNTSTQTGEPPPKNPHDVTYRLHRMNYGCHCECVRCNKEVWQWLHKEHLMFIKS